MAARGIRSINVGRPRTYSPALAEEAVLIGAKGGSLAAIAVAFGVSRARIDEWERLYPEFREGIARAKDAAQQWWELHGQSNLKADRYQAQVWTRTMAARFAEYRDKPTGSEAAGAFVDFLGALGELADAAKAAKRQPIAASQPGDTAKAIEAVVVKDDAPSER